MPCVQVPLSAQHFGLESCNNLVAAVLAFGTAIPALSDCLMLIVSSNGLGASTRKSEVIFGRAVR